MSCFGENLKRVREEKNLTIEELALKARLGVKTLERYENNIQLPASQTILKLLTVLDVPASALLEKRNNNQLS
ncbi:helix-turn-helix domain-containing protein [Jeotgalibacillus proteolyticus]|uniref:helix-turn-helix domain-containing protein n=1 Tax=Jeotgalibacillus proteolyticus TaxID=2082395 RepID=UPI003CED88AC